MKGVKKLKKKLESKGFEVLCKQTTKVSTNFIYLEQLTIIKNGLNIIFEVCPSTIDKNCKKIAKRVVQLFKELD